MFSVVFYIRHQQIFGTFILAIIWTVNDTDNQNIF